jgi:ketosteroid isomerase-like protein
MSPSTRLGPWSPSTPEERLDRLESLALIQQLPARYARAVDARDMDALVELFVPDVKAGPGASGRDAMRAWFVEALSRMRMTVHFVGQHVVDFQDADNATGTVYCHDELDFPDRGTWEWGKIQYWDRYVRLDGEWFFKYRRFNRAYIVDALERPAHGAVDVIEGLPSSTLPDVYETWGSFWAEVGVDPY